LRGTSARAPRPGEPRRSPRPISGGWIFAEQPSLAAPDATIIWSTALDPGILRVEALPAPEGACEDALDPAALQAWMTIVADRDGREHVVLSDGWRHIRLDVDGGSLRTGIPVVLRYRVEGQASARAVMLPLQRFLHLCRYRTFARTLFPPDLRMPRWITLLRVHDGIEAGASQREIAEVLFGDAVVKDWRGASESWRYRVRRLVGEARAMAAGGYRALLRGAVSTTLSP